MVINDEDKQGLYPKKCVKYVTVTANTKVSLSCLVIVGVLPTSGVSANAKYLRILA